MYRQESNNVNPEFVNYDCPVCETAKSFIITNFRVDLYKGMKVCILSNDLMVDRICLDCLNKAINQWNATN